MLGISRSVKYSRFADLYVRDKMATQGEVHALSVGRGSCKFSTTLLIAFIELKEP